MLVASLVVLALVTVACSNSDSIPTKATAPISVVTTSNIVADWVRQVGQDKVEVFSLIQPSTDPHSFQPGARDITRVADADLLLTIGLNLEGEWLKELVNNAASNQSLVLVLGDITSPIEFVSFNEEQDEHDHEELDPHFWFDPLRVKLVAASIAEQLAKFDAENSAYYLENAVAYQAELDALHLWIEQQTSLIPQERKLLVTSHDSFGYFANQYDFRIIGTVIPGTTTEIEPSALELTELVERIREHNVPAIFTENIVSNRMTERIAEEADVKVVTGLYTGSLGDSESPASSYIDMMRTDVTLIVEALK